jgi:hypothetical protein
MANFGIFRGFGEKLFEGEIPINLGTIGSLILGNLLDDYPNAAAAFSLRKLRTAYTGNAIRVRRSIDNIEQDFGFMQGELDTSALLSFCSTGNGFITVWYDQSGNGKNATQATLALQPKIVSGGVLLTSGSKPSMQYDNTGSNNLKFANIINPRSIFGVVQVTQLSQYQGLPVSDDDFNDYHGGLDTYLLDNALTDTVQSGINKINGVTVNLRTKLRNLDRNLISIISASTNRVNQINQNRGSATRAQRGFISEVLIYENDQTANRDGIESNINTFYSIY